MAQALPLSGAFKPALAAALLVGAGWWWLHPSAAGWRGTPAPADPVQTTDDLPAPFALKEFTLTPLARYSIQAVVLSRARYWLDRQAPIMPIDLALGWGPMSEAAPINALSISQNGRWYEYWWRDEPPLDPGVIATHSANTHCIPAPKVRDKLLAVARHDLVTLEGYLVEVATADGWKITSSTARDDTGGGACEVVWVTDVKRRRAR